MNDLKCILTYAKARRNSAAFIEKRNELLKGMDELFDIFCEDASQRRKLEVKHQLLMTKTDFDYYYDQKGPRLGKCVEKVERLTEKDLLFKNRIKQSISRENKRENPGCSYVPNPVDEDSDHNEQDSEDDIDMEEEYRPPRSTIKNKTEQNRKNWPNLVSMVERFQVSDRAGAAIANAVLKDIGFISASNSKHTICKNKLRRERTKYREEIRKKEQEFFDLVDGVYLDGRKDSTLTSLIGDNGNPYQDWSVLEEHYVVVGNPGVII